MGCHQVSRRPGMPGGQIPELGTLAWLVDWQPGKLDSQARQRLPRGRCCTAALLTLPVDTFFVKQFSVLYADVAFFATSLQRSPRYRSDY